MESDAPDIECNRHRIEHPPTWTKHPLLLNTPWHRIKCCGHEIHFPRYQTPAPSNCTLQSWIQTPPISNMLSIKLNVHVIESNTLPLLNCVSIDSNTVAMEWNTPTIKCPSHGIKHCSHRIKYFHDWTSTQLNWMMRPWNQTPSYWTTTGIESNAAAMGLNILAIESKTATTKHLRRNLSIKNRPAWEKKREPVQSAPRCAERENEN